MKTMNKAAAKVLDELTAGLGVGEARKIDNARGTFMAVSVERLTETTFSVSHYYEQNGDLVPDPDMEFWRGPDGAWYPVAIQHSSGHYLRAIEFSETDKPSGFRPRALTDLASFAATWMKNIRAQQSL